MALEMETVVVKDLLICFSLKKQGNSLGSEIIFGQRAIKLLFTGKAKL